MAKKKAAKKKAATKKAAPKKAAKKVAKKKTTKKPGRIKSIIDEVVRQRRRRGRGSHRRRQRTRRQAQGQAQSPPRKEEITRHVHQHLARGDSDGSPAERPGPFFLLAAAKNFCQESPIFSFVIRISSFDDSRLPRLSPAAFSATMMGFPAGLKVGCVGRLACGNPPFSFGKTLVLSEGESADFAASKLGPLEHRRAMTLRRTGLPKKVFSLSPWLTAI